MRSELFETRFHGRGGQGVVIVSKILGYAAFLEGYSVQCFPEFGVERRGAPVRAYLRVSQGQIYVRSAIERPDCVVVLDPNLVAQKETSLGAKEGTILIFNSRGQNWNFEFAAWNVFAVNASQVALRNKLGTATTPIVNTAMAGAFAKATGTVNMESVEKAIEKYSPVKVKENVKAALEAYEETEQFPFAVKK